MNFDTLDDVVRTAGGRMGVTGLDPFPEVAAVMGERLASGASAGLGFTYSDVDVATTPRSSFPWGASLVVVVMPYLRDGDGSSDSPELERTIARFADGDRYQELRTVLDILVELLESEGHRAEAVIDDDRLVDRAVAIRAGVAWWGKSTMALAPGFGPWFLIGSVVTDAEFDHSTAMVRTCGSCDACIPACPTGAIVRPGMLDAGRCIAAILQGRGSIPEDLRPAVGGRVYGCDECLVACPPGFPTLDGVSVAPSIHPRVVLSRSDRELDAHHSHWYIPGRSMRFVRRNALVALGNVGDDRDVGVLAGYVGHHDGLLRSHAAWALGRIASDRADTILAAAARRERNHDVLRDIETARAACAAP